MAKLVVHAGNFPKGVGAVAFDVFMMPPENLWQQWSERVPFTQVASVELATEESVKRIGGAVGWGAVGAIALGPLGLLAGVLAGGNGKDSTFFCTLNCGRKFMATTDSATFTKLKAACWAQLKS